MKQLPELYNKIISAFWRKQEKKKEKKKKCLDAASRIKVLGISPRIEAMLTGYQAKLANSA